MKKLLLFLLLSGYAFSQTNCELCVEQNGFYCGDDESNWTQYSPLGCVPNGAGGLYYLNDNWEDCVDGSDENEAVPTTLAECQVYVVPCDTVYVNTIDTVFIDVIEYVELTEYIDCDTGLPCNTSIVELINKSKNNNKIYDLSGKEILRPKGLYIQNGKVKYKLN